VQELGGSTARQTAELANGNIPYHERHGQFINGLAGGAGMFWGFFFLLFFSSSVFLGVQSFFLGGTFVKFAKSVSLGFHNCC